MYKFSRGPSKYLASFIAIICLFLNQNALSLGSPGPSISAAATRPSQVKALDDTAPLDLKLSKVKESAEAVAPVANGLGGDWYFKYQYDHETRRHSGASASSDFSARFSSVGTNYVGAIYATKNLLPKATTYWIAGRFGSLDPRHDVRPMGEYFGIIVFRAADYGLKLLQADSDTTTLLLRIRNWPDGNQYTPIFMQKFSLGHGLTLDIGIISHIRLTWNSNDDKWGVYVNGEASSQQYPDVIDRDDLWIRGHVIDAYLGVRRHLASIFFVAVEGGMHQDHSAFIDRNGKTLREQESSFAPWGRLRLETFVD